MTRRAISSESIFEADDRSLIDPEEAARLLTERASLQIAGEAMGQPEIALEQGQTHCGRQIDDDKVRFCLAQDRIVVLSRLRAFRRRAGARGRAWFVEQRSQRVGHGRTW